MWILEGPAVDQGSFIVLLSGEGLREMDRGLVAVSIEMGSVYISWCRREKPPAAACWGSCIVYCFDTILPPSHLTANMALAHPYLYYHEID